MTEPTSHLTASALSPGLTVDDLDASMDFYGKLGFEVEERWEDEGRLMGAMLRAGDVRIGLAQDDWAKGRDRTKGVGLRFWIVTAQDVDELAARARDNGLTLDSGPEDLPWGGRGFSVTDPDGFMMTISQGG